MTGGRDRDQESPVEYDPRTWEEAARVALAAPGPVRSRAEAAWRRAGFAKQANVARAAGVGKNRLSEALRGNRAHDWEGWTAVAEALCVPVAWLRHGTGIAVRGETLPHWLQHPARVVDVVNQWRHDPRRWESRGELKWKAPALEALAKVENEVRGGRALIPVSVAALEEIVRLAGKHGSSQLVAELAQVRAFGLWGEEVPPVLRGPGLPRVADLAGLESRKTKRRR